MLCEIWGFIVCADENYSRMVHDIVWKILKLLWMFRWIFVPLLFSNQHLHTKCCSNKQGKKNDSIRLSRLSIYRPILCFIWEAISHYINRYEAMHLTKSLLELVNKIPIERWCSCGDFTLYKYKPKDWNLYNDAVYC